MQKIQAIGNITKDATINNVGGRNAINFNLAINESYKNKDGVKVDKAVFYSCSIWKDSAQSTEIAKYLLKGKKVYLEGKPSAELYTDKEGQKKIDNRINVAFVELLSPMDKTEPVNEATQENTASFATSKGDDLPF